MHVHTCDWHECVCQDNDPSLTEVNLNNHGGLDSDLIMEIFRALQDNVHLESLQMANVRIDENHAAVSRWWVWSGGVMHMWDSIASEKMVLPYLKCLSIIVLKGIHAVFTARTIAFLALLWLFCTCSTFI